MLDELPLVFSEPLQPDGEKSAFTAPELPVPPPTKVEAAAAPFQTLIHEYEKLPRKVRDLWGHRRSAALGVKVVRHFTGASFPEPSPLHRAARTVVGIPLLILMAAVVQPASFLFGTSLLIVAVLSPLVGAVGHVVAVPILVVCAFAFGTTVVKRSYTHYWLVTLASMALILSTLLWFGHIVPFHRVFAPIDKSPLHGWTEPLWSTRSIVLAALVTAIATFVAVWFLWNWAKRAWRYGVSLTAGVVIGGWQILAAWRPPHAPDGASGVLHAFRSPAWPAIVLVIATTWCALYCRPEHRPGADPP